MKKSLIIIIALVIAVAFGILLIKSSRKETSLSSAINLPYQTNSTGTIATVGNTPTQVLASKSGRVYFRLTNTGTSTISCAITSSTAGMVNNAGIVIDQPGLTTSTNTYFDSGETNIIWDGAINCISSVTTTMAIFEK